MNTRYSWDEVKRQTNLDKHGLDFVDADLVLDNPYRMDIVSRRKGERRVQSFAYVFEALAVLTVVFLPGTDQQRIISYRRAKRTEREVYYDWLENDYDDA